ncbi:hypothetical protein PVAP13_3NG088801 [Panicum virgatum]|uniref:Uncharacterized protein n=1 Tax=Panicum virgatum TaxID=38727 RepID=A0A8T0UHR0_PANVG|nr:hypothetical protein PVAP13_3NG088801 [Panicum virgatum]
MGAFNRFLVARRPAAAPSKKQKNKTKPTCMSTDPWTRVRTHRQREPPPSLLPAYGTPILPHALIHRPRAGSARADLLSAHSLTKPTSCRRPPLIHRSGGRKTRRPQIARQLRRTLLPPPPQQQTLAVCPPPNPISRVPDPAGGSASPASPILPAARYLRSVRRQGVPFLILVSISSFRSPLNLSTRPNFSLWFEQGEVPSPSVHGARRAWLFCLGLGSWLRAG